MQVRATTKVLDANQSGSQATITSMHELSGLSQRPSIEELKEVLNMQHLVRCVEHMYWEGSIDMESSFCVSLPADCREGGYDTMDELELKNFRDGFYRAMYRMLLAGAVMAGAYQEPFTQAEKDGREGFLQRNKTGDFDDEDLAFLRQFPVYNFDVLDTSTTGKWRNKSYNIAFGPFAEWLVEDGRARGVRENPESRGAVRELMLLLVAHEHLLCKFNHKEYVPFFGEEAVHEGYRTKIRGFEGKPRHVSVVLYGDFQVRQVTMPASIEDSGSILLPTTIHPLLKAADKDQGLNIAKATQALETHTRGRMSDGDENPNPPAMFELWFFALRHYLNLGFSAGSFWIWRECTWWEEVCGGHVFVDPTWEIVQPYVEGEVSWYKDDE